jgi:hypothetical protein
LEIFRGGAGAGGAGAGGAGAGVADVEVGGMVSVGGLGFFKVERAFNTEPLVLDEGRVSVRASFRVSGRSSASRVATSESLGKFDLGLNSPKRPVFFFVASGG